MTNSDTHLAQDWFADIYGRIAPHHLDRTIDIPVDAVTHQYISELQPVRSHAKLVAVIAAYVQRLHEKALPMKGSIAFHEAFAEGVALLSAAQINGATGYELAVLSIQSDGNAEETVLQIAAVVKARQRENIVKWTIEDAVARCAWDDRLRLVAGLVEAAGDSLPSAVSTRPTEQWAPFLGDLVHMVYLTVSKIEEMRPHCFGLVERPRPSPMSFLIRPPFVHAEAGEEDRNAFSQAET